MNDAVVREITDGEIQSMPIDHRETACNLMTYEGLIRSHAEGGFGQTRCATGHVRSANRPSWAGRRPGSPPIVSEGRVV